MQYYRMAIMPLSSSHSSSVEIDKQHHAVQISRKDYDASIDVKHSMKIVSGGINRSIQDLSDS